LDKINYVSTKEGKTILFVSHNLDAINFLCNSAMLIEKGQIVSDEKHLSKDDILRKYKNLNSGAEKKLYLKYHSNSNDTNLIREVYFSDKRNNFMFEEEFRLYIKVNVVSKVNLSIELCNSNNLRIWVKEKKITNSGIYCIKFNKNHLILGEYKIKCYLTIPNVEYIQITDELFFNIENWPKEFFHYSNIDKQKNPIGIIYNSEEIEKSN
jgi:lipopolysaccharide transport system ATP-binding protein